MSELVKRDIEVVDTRAVFGFEFTIYGDIENPLFLAKDVANWIEHSNLTMMLRNIDEDEQIKIRPKQSLGLLTSNNEYNFLTEDGLYEVLMQSRKPIAKQFKKEVKKVLKEIRLKQFYIEKEISDKNLLDLETKVNVLIAERDVLEDAVKALKTKNNDLTREVWDRSFSSYNYSELAKLCKMNVKELKDNLVKLGICYMDITTMRISPQYRSLFNKQGSFTYAGAMKVRKMIKNL